MVKKSDGSQVKESTDSSSTTIEDDDVRGTIETYDFYSFCMFNPRQHFAKFAAPRFQICLFFVNLAA